MKLQCGVLYRDGKNVTDLDIATVLGPFKGWNAETAGEVVDRSLAMAYRGEHITVEDETEAQPVRCGPYLMTWDGRLDNRSEVAARVGLQGTVALSDAELVLKASGQMGRDHHQCPGNRALCPFATFAHLPGGPSSAQ